MITPTVSPKNVLPPKREGGEYPIYQTTYGKIFIQACGVLPADKTSKATDLGKTPTFGYTINLPLNQGIQLKEYK